MRKIAPLSPILLAGLIALVSSVISLAGRDGGGAGAGSPAAVRPSRVVVASPALAKHPG